MECRSRAARERKADWVDIVGVVRRWVNRERELQPRVEGPKGYELGVSKDSELEGWAGCRDRSGAASTLQSTR